MAKYDLAFNRHWFVDPPPPFMEMVRELGDPERVAVLQVLAEAEATMHQARADAYGRISAIASKAAGVNRAGGGRTSSEG